MPKGLKKRKQIREQRIEQLKKQEEEAVIRKEESREAKKEEVEEYVRKEIPDYAKNVVYVGRIPHGFYEKEMRIYMQQYGPITNLRISRSKKHGKSRGYGFVQFMNRKQAAHAADDLNGTFIAGKVVVSELLDPEQVDRRIWDQNELHYDLAQLDKKERLRGWSTKIGEHTKKVRPKLIEENRQHQMSKHIRKLRKQGIMWSFLGAKTWEEHEEKRRRSIRLKMKHQLKRAEARLEHDTKAHETREERLRLKKEYLRDSNLEAYKKLLIAGQEQKKEELIRHQMKLLEIGTKRAKDPKLVFEEMKKEKKQKQQLKKVAMEKAKAKEASKKPRAALSKKAQRVSEAKARVKKEKFRVRKQNRIAKKASKEKAIAAKEARKAVAKKL